MADRLPPCAHPLRGRHRARPQARAGRPRQDAPRQPAPLPGECLLGRGADAGLHTTANTRIL